MSLRGSPSDDRGVILIVVAVAMVALLIVVAMTIDLGSRRSNRRTDQAVADLAALAAGSFLAGNGGPTVEANARFGCKAAAHSAIMNVPGFAPSQAIDTTCAAFPTNAATSCSETTTPIDAVFSDARYELTVRFPVPDSELSDARFTGGSGSNDGTNQCQRIRATFSETNPTSFARVIGVNLQYTVATAVVRASPQQLGKGVAALLLLERLGCGTLQNSGQAAVVVKAPTATNPGVIQSDSAGQVPPCSSNDADNAGAKVIYGPQLPASAGSGPSIVAENSADGSPGILGMYSLGLFPPGRGAAVYPLGLSHAPTKSSITSRQPVDDKYNGASAQITNLHTAAYPMTNWSSATATAAGYAIVNECDGSGIPLATLTAPKVFVNCDTFNVNTAALILPNASHFIVRGNIDIGNGGVLSLPAVKHFYVRGCHYAGCSSGSARMALRVQGKLIVNSGETVNATPDPYVDGTKCSARRGPGAGGSTTNWTTLVTFGGDVSITGQARLCQTVLYMGRNTPTYSRSAVITTSVAPENYPSLAGCSPTLPCPKDGVDTAWSFVVSGGAPETDWSAPNQLAAQPDGSDFAANPFEDLALWTETSATNAAIKGKAGTNSEGVFFLPNASVLFQGQGTQPIALNAQFIARNVNISGQGTLTMTPNPHDSVLSPVPGAVSLIR